MKSLRPSALTQTDARRFVYCLLIAALVHAAGAFSPRLRTRRHHAEAPTPLRGLVPVSLDDAPPPEAPAPAAPPEPATPPAPPAPAAPTPTPDRPSPEREPVAAPSEPRRHEPRKAPPPAPPKASAAIAEPAPAEPGEHGDDATPFGGTEGAFTALVCFVRRGVRSALAVDDCKPVTGFRTNVIDVPPRRFRHGFPGVERRVEWFGIDYRGRFKVKRTGYYTFRLLSDDGAVLYIDGETVVDNDGIHGPRSRTMSLPLTKGSHDFRLLYYQGPGSILALQLFVKGFKTEEQLFGPEF